MVTTILFLKENEKKTGPKPWQKKVKKKIATTILPLFCSRGGRGEMLSKKKKCSFLITSPPPLHPLFPSSRLFAG